MARSTFYYHRERLSKPDKYGFVKAAIQRIYAMHKGRYGYRRVTAQLRSEGVLINHKTVYKLMSEMGLKGRRRKSRYNSYKGEVGKIVPNVIGREFAADAPNQKWTTDVTEVKIKNRKIYLSTILDMFNGEIISYEISDSPDMKMAMKMLSKAFRKAVDTEGLILHSDQGWHYQQVSYQKALKDRKIIQSMSGKGNCVDNAVMESFFGVLKSELLYIRDWESVDQFKKELIKYLRYYNNSRIKMRLNGKSPIKYRVSFQAGFSASQIRSHA